MSKETYHNYLLSDHWRKLKAEKFRKSGYACEGCTRRDSREVHHLVYRNPVESGLVGDLMVLCGRCHEIVHEAMRRKVILQTTDPIIARKGVGIALKAAYGKHLDKMKRAAELSLQAQKDHLDRRRSYEPGKRKARWQDYNNSTAPSFEWKTPVFRSTGTIIAKSGRVYG